MMKYAGLFKGIDQEQGEEDLSLDNQEPQEAPGRFTLLFVDDEEGVLRSLGRIFLEEDYHILTASNASDALAVMEKEKVHLVISDHRMPGMTGAQLLAKVREKWPETIRIMLTGYVDIQSIMGAVNDGAVYKFITKPWNDEDLRLSVSLALQQYALIQENKKLKDLTRKQRGKISKYSGMLDEDKSVLANYLMKSGEVSKDDMVRVIREKEDEETIGEALVRLGVISESGIVKVLQEHLHFEYVDLKEMELRSNVVKFLPRELCEKNRVLPVRIDAKQFTLAMADPSDMYKIDNIATMTSMKVVPVIARSSDILALLKIVYGEVSEPLPQGDTFDGLDEMDLEFEPLDEIDIVIEEDEDQINIDELLSSSKVPPIIRIVNAIISEAIRFEASDIHIEPKTKYTVVRFRVDGMLHNKIKIPSEIHPATVSRIKIIGKMDIAERRLPQDGRITVKSGTRIVDIRVSTMPTINGEKIVMRILDKNASIKNIHELGLQAAELADINVLIKKPQGIIIATGPTGSGKTTMLYSMLNTMLETTKNFQTIEDPVEYFLEEASQIYIKEKTGLSFSSVLRSTLRQDPDVILVGEIRDYETADVAFKAALTGHMVLTTLHTNNTVASITRLLDMGVRPYLLASAMEGVVAQRLVRKNCPHCRREQELDPSLLDLLKISPATLGGKEFKGAGCDRCNQTGYFGRMGIFEVFNMNDAFRHFISSSYKEAELMKMAKSGGMLTLLDDGIEKVKQGLTTLDEILRVLGSQARYDRQCESCKKMIDVNFLFCPFCGSFKHDYCKSCQAHLEGQWEHCPFCGTVKGEEAPGMVQ